MRNRIDEYLAKRADLTPRPLVAGPVASIDQVVVIPVLDESGRLFQTIESLATNPRVALDRTLVICVVNNRALPFAEAASIEDNQRALARLAALVCDGHAGLRLGYVDASSRGYELPEKSGVGLARKIGLDFGLSVLARNDAPRGLLFSLDADTLVESNYLPAVRDHFDARNTWAAAVSYAHPLLGAPEIVAGIVCYETFLRYHVLGLRHARSPYAFHSIGSTMVCRGDAYAAVAGMNQRLAGEDFYFLQQLAKTGGVQTIAATTVHPSSRPSTRVPFGTGARIRRFLAGGEHEYEVYDPASYSILKAWFSCVSECLDADADVLLSRATAITPPLKDFLEAQHFAQTWPRLQANASSPQYLLAQFHGWFDGFKTLKFIHYLRDHGFPERDLFESVARLLEWMGTPGDIASAQPAIEDQMRLLRRLRDRSDQSDPTDRL